MGHIMRQNFPNMSDKLWAIQPHKMVRGLKFWILVKKMYCTMKEAKIKALITCTVTVQLICIFVFAYAKTSHGILIMRLKFSHDDIRQTESQ